jgi:uncharacterized protein
VKVMEVDVKRQRIALSMRLDDVPGQSAQRAPREATANSAADPRREQRRDGGRNAGRTNASASSSPAKPESAMALAFARLKK